MNSLKDLPLWAIALPLFALLPLAYLVHSSSTILEDHIRTVVVNEPSEGLKQMTQGLKTTFDPMVEKLMNSCEKVAESGSLRKAMESPRKNLSKVASLGQETSKDFPFFILCDPKGNILYDNLGIPRPVVSPEPTPTKSSKKVTSSKGKTQVPTPTVQLASLRENLDLGQDLPDPGSTGFLPHGDKAYLVTSRTVRSQGKILGQVLLGRELDPDFLSSLKTGTGGDLTILSQDRTWATDPSAPSSSDSGTVTLSWNGQDFLSLSVPFPDFKGKSPWSVRLYHPIRSSRVLEGSPQESLSRIGWWLLLVTGLLTTLLSAFSFLTFKGLLHAMERIPEGGAVPSLPDWAPGEWGRLGRALMGLRTSQREKDRMSLILGKVVSPQAAKKLLEANDLFALKGEKRECTLLYAELKGFQTLSENMPPPALVEALNQYFGLINDAVFHHEGMLDRFMGEKVLAVWGAPFSHEDKETRAVKAALEIQGALKDFNIARIKKGFPPFTLGIGIHTGALVAGNLGSEKHHDYTVIGEALQVAARLCAMATPGQVVVSEETYGKVQATAKANPLNPLALRDRMEPLKTYEITELL
jgi:class 3 adenylate cyclase